MAGIVSVCLILPTDSLYENQWAYVLRNFKPDQVFLLGGNEGAQREVFQSATVIDSLFELPDVPRVVMAAEDGRHVKGNIPLSEFSHPEDAIYIFGPDERNLNIDTDGDSLVYVDTDGSYEMYSWVAYAVAMWDRRSKVA